MHEYDVALKLLLQAASDSTLCQLVGVPVTRWLNAEVPQVQTSRADLLGATSDGQLVHLELQSANDADMVLRMAEYALRIFRQYRQFPRHSDPVAGSGGNCPPDSPKDCTNGRTRQTRRTGPISDNLRTEAASTRRPGRNAKSADFE